MCDCFNFQKTFTCWIRIRIWILIRVEADADPGSGSLIQPMRIHIPEIQNTTKTKAALDTHFADLRFLLIQDI